MTNQSNVLRFRRKLRRRSTNGAPAQMRAFPTSRHVKIVGFISRAMREQPSQDAAERYLVSHLETEWSRLEGLGVDPVEIERSCRLFASAAWRVTFASVHHEDIA